MKFSEVAKHYIGCEVLDSYSGEVRVLSGIGIDGVYVEYNGLNFLRQVNEIKPILRRLEDMTEEDMKELWQLIFKRELKRYTVTLYSDEPRRLLIRQSIERLCIQTDTTIWADSDLQRWKYNQHEVTHFLCQRSYDLFNLITSGEALDSKTVKKGGDGE